MYAFKTRTILAALLALSAVGCGAPAPSVGSCLVADQGAGYSVCLEYPNLGNATDVMAACRGTGSFAAGACSPTNRAGRCTTVFSGTTATASYYAPMTTADVQRGCTSGGGTFMAN